MTSFLCRFFIIIVFFFFQAEDGIRDYKVTGVQTCALPISVQLMVTVMTASWEPTTVAPTAPTPVTPPVVAAGVDVIVTVATANLVGSELLVTLTLTVAGSGTAGGAGSSTVGDMQPCRKLPPRTSFPVHAKAFGGRP